MEMNLDEHDEGHSRARWNGRCRNWKAGVSGIVRDLFLITIPQKLLLSQFFHFSSTLFPSNDHHTTSTYLSCMVL